jgi:4-hydroxy-tetrahydrodipicolinate synthase
MKNPDHCEDTGKSKMLMGIIPYIVTPTTEKSRLNERVLAELVDHLIQKGVHGLAPMGSTGEGVYLDRDTKRQVIKTTVAVSGGRVPIIAGVNSMSTKDAIAEAVEAEQLGADAILVVLPTYFPVKDDQVAAHFRAVARNVSCPVILYTNPHFSKWDFTISTLKIIAEEPNVHYLKDASGNMGKLMSIFVALGDRLKIFSATAHVPLFVFMLGGVGWMSGPACLIPELSIKLYELAKEKKWQEALTLQKKLWPLNMAFQQYSLSACVKAGLEMQGFAVGNPIPPQSQLDEDGRKTVRRILGDVGVL